jgi:hypothetical protein
MAFIGAANVIKGFQQSQKIPAEVAPSIGVTAASNENHILALEGRDDDEDCSH